MTAIRERGDFQYSTLAAFVAAFTSRKVITSDTEVATALIAEHVSHKSGVVPSGDGAQPAAQQEESNPQVS